MRHLSYHPTLRTCSSDTILRAIKELTQENISYTSDKGKTYDFNTADKLNALLIKALVSKPKGRFFRSTNQKNRPFGLWFVILHNFYIGVFSWLLIA